MLRHALFPGAGLHALAFAGPGLAQTSAPEATAHEEVIVTANCL